MICFNCGYKFNSENAEKCSVCNVSFQKKCSKCGSANPKFAKYCINCGSPLLEIKEEITEMRKNIAVIFADISGFTKLSESMDPEDVRELINDCFEYITKPVYELEGTIDKYIGDCVMILFGARYSHSDDAKRAVKCAFKMMKCIEDFSKERLLPDNLKLCIGINYGLVAAGRIGSYYDKDYTVMGDVVNTAQRIQSSAKPGTILVSKEVYDITSDIVYYSEGIDILAKNKQNPVRCFAPVSMKYNEDFENLILYDRENELNMLSEAILSKESFIEVYGKSGTGKSSLAKKVYKSIDSNINKIWVDCSIMYMEKPYNTLSNIVLSILNVKTEDSQKIKKNRLRSFIDFLMINHTEEETEKIFNYMSFILGLERDSSFERILNSMNYQDIKRELINQIDLFIKLSSKKQSFVIVIDDAQWADKESMLVLSEISRSYSTFIFISQYKLELDNLKQKFEVSINLENLSLSGIREYILEKLSCQKINDIMLNTFADITQGNPLYLRELTNTVKNKAYYYIVDDTAFIKDNIINDLPSTIENAVYSAFRELNFDTAKFIEAASIVGREFSLSTVTKLLDTETDDPDILKIPVKLNLIAFKEISTSSLNNDRIYAFTQEVYRDVIYKSIMKKTKKEYHKRLAMLIENEHAKDIQSYYDIIAMHYFSANISTKAAYYYIKSAEKYRANFLYSGAVESYKKYLNIAEKLENIDVLNSLISLGEIYNDMGSFEEAHNVLETALSKSILSDDKNKIKLLIAENYKDKGDFPDSLSIINEIQEQLKRDSSLYGRLLQIKCSIYIMLGKNDAIEISKEAEEILIKINDLNALSSTLGQIGIWYFINGQSKLSLGYLHRALKYAEEADNKKELSSIAVNLGIVYHATGHIPEALEYFNKGLETARVISNIKNIINVDINMGILYMDKGVFDKASDLFNEVLEKSEEIGLAYQHCISLTNLGDIEFERANYDNALECYKKSTCGAIDMELTVEQAINCIGSAKTYISLNNLNKADELLEKSFSLLTEANEISYLSDYYRLKALISYKNSNLLKAIKLLQKAEQLSNECDSNLKKLLVLRLYGIILMDLNNFIEAEEKLTYSIYLALEVQSDYQISKSYYRRYILYKKTKNKEYAQKDLFNAIQASEKISNCKFKSVINELKIQIE